MLFLLYWPIRIFTISVIRMISKLTRRTISIGIAIKTRNYELINPIVNIRIAKTQYIILFNEYKLYNQNN